MATNIGLIALDIRPRPTVDKVRHSLISCLNEVATTFPNETNFSLWALGDRMHNTWSPILSLFQPRWSRHFTHSWTLFLPESLQELVQLCTAVVCFEEDSRREMLRTRGVKVVSCAI